MAEGNKLESPLEVRPCAPWDPRPRCAPWVYNKYRLVDLVIRVVIVVAVVIVVVKLAEALGWIVAPF